MLTPSHRPEIAVAAPGVILARRLAYENIRRALLVFEDKALGIMLSQ